MIREGITTGFNRIYMFLPEMVITFLSCFQKGYYTDHGEWPPFMYKTYIKPSLHFPFIE